MVAVLEPIACWHILVIHESEHYWCCTYIPIEKAILTKGGFNSPTDFNFFKWFGYFTTFQNFKITNEKLQTTGVWRLFGRPARRGTGRSDWLPAKRLSPHTARSTPPSTTRFPTIMKPNLFQHCRRIKTFSIKLTLIGKMRTERMGYSSSSRQI